MVRAGFFNPSLDGGLPLLLLFSPSRRFNSATLGVRGGQRLFQRGILLPPTRQFARFAPAAAEPAQSASRRRSELYPTLKVRFTPPLPDPSYRLSQCAAEALNRGPSSPRVDVPPGISGITPYLVNRTFATVRGRTSHVKGRPMEKVIFGNLKKRASQVKRSAGEYARMLLT